MVFEPILTVVACICIIEGVLPALFPNRWQAYLKMLSEQPAAAIRKLGIAMLIFGLLLLWWLSC